MPGNYLSRHLAVAAAAVAVESWGCEALVQRPSFPPGTGLSKAFARQRLDVQTVLQRGSPERAAKPQRKQAVFAKTTAANRDGFSVAL